MGTRAEQRGGLRNLQLPPKTCPCWELGVARTPRGFAAEDGSLALVRLPPMLRLPSVLALCRSPAGVRGSPPPRSAGSGLTAGLRFSFCKARTPAAPSS